MYPASIIPEQLYTSEEVSEHLRLSLRTIQRLLHTRALNSYKLHGQYRIKGLDLLNYLDQNRQSHLADLVPSQAPIEMAKMLDVKPISIDFGLDWIPFLQSSEAEESTELLEQISTGLRHQLVQELGFIMPGIQMQDDASLPASGFCIKLQGVSLIQGELLPDALYLRKQNPLRHRHLQAVYEVSDHPDAKSGQLHFLDLLKQVIRSYACEILSRDEVSVILERLRPQREVVIDEVLSTDPQSHKLKIGQLTQILRSLLQEQVSIRNLGLILELLADALIETNQLDELVEKTREGLARQINAPFVNAEQVMAVYGLSPEFENELMQVIAEQNLPAQSDCFRRLHHAMSDLPENSVLICAPALRKQIFLHCRRLYPDLQVFSYREIAREYRIQLVRVLL